MLPIIYSNIKFNKDSFHFFKKFDKYFLIRINDLATYEISSFTYDILNLISSQNLKNNLKPKVSNKIENILSELYKLEIINNGSTKNKIDRITNKLCLNGKKLTRLILVVSQDCNLRCKYCSAQFGRFGIKPSVKLMTKNIAAKSIDFYLKNFDNLFNPPIILFDGGEPLLNFEVIKFCVEYARNINSQTCFSLTTNGSLIDRENAEWLVNNIGDIIISIDGTKQIHDENRVYENGNGSYNDAIRGLRLIQEYANNNYTVRTSIPNGKNYLECIHNIWDLGVSSVIANCSVESNFISSRKFRMNKKEWLSFFKEWEILANEITNYIISDTKNKNIHLFNLYFDSIAYRRPLLRGCGIGRRVSITTDGSIYMCNGLTGIKNYKIGDIYNGINYDFSKFEKIYNDYYEKCQSCWARFICGTGCIAQSIKYNELDDSFPVSRSCDFNKKAIESVIYMYYKIKTEKKNSIFYDNNNKF